MNFFVLKTKPVPPSLSSEGHIRLGTKSDIAGILENVLDSPVESSVHFDAVLYDGAAIVNICPPKLVEPLVSMLQKSFALHLETS